MRSLREYLAEHNNNKIKLHLGCGGVRWKDFINVDFYPYDHSTNDSSRSDCVADAFADMRNLQLAENSIEEIFTSHTFEHFPRWDGEEMLADWFRMLKPGGKLVIETPDFWRCILWLFHPSSEKRRLGRTQFYGNQWDQLDYETHRYLWTSKEIHDVCNRVGFARVVVTHRTETHYSGRDMRVEAWK